MFLDRVYTDNKNFELYCLMCGGREFVSKSSRLGKWLERKEWELKRAGSLPV